MKDIQFTARERSRAVLWYEDNGQKEQQGLNICLRNEIFFTQSGEKYRRSCLPWKKREQGYPALTRNNTA